MTTTSALSAEDPGSVAQQERRKRILDATTSLASRGGFDAVQMRAVAEQADVALGTLYRYFPSKIHLLVSVLGRELEAAEAANRERPVPGDTPHERVRSLLDRATHGFQREPHLTEALTRAFMFADASVQAEVNTVGLLLTSMLTRTMHPGKGDLVDEDVAIARVIGDVWLSALAGWVTGRTTADDVDQQLDVAVRRLLR